MNTQLNTIFSKVQFRTVLVYFFCLVLLMVASATKIYLDVKKEKEHLVEVVLNSQALHNYGNAPKEIEKTIKEIKKDGYKLYMLTHLDIYFLNDNGSALFWVTNGSEKTILNRNDVKEIPEELNSFFKNNNFHSKQTIKDWFFIRIKPNSNVERSIVLCIPEHKLWLENSMNSLIITAISLLLISFLFLYQNMSVNYWLKKPLSKFIKHLEYESQGINSELERDVPTEWQDLFMEFNLSFDKEIIHEGNSETEEQATQRFHAQLQELRWAKEQLANYEKQITGKDKESTFNSKLGDFFNTFDNATIGIMIADADTIPIFINAKGKELLGKGVLPISEDDLLDVRKIFIEGTDVEVPHEHHPMLLAKKTSQPQLVKHIEAFNPTTNERKGIKMMATPITAYTSMNEYYLVLISEEA